MKRNELEPPPVREFHDRVDRWHGVQLQIPVCVSWNVAKLKVVHPAAPIRLRNLPVVMDLERKLQLYSPIRGPISPQVEWHADRASRELFGITRKDTEFDRPDELLADVEYEDPWLYDISDAERQRYEFERRFKTTGVGEEEVSLKWVTWMEELARSSAGLRPGRLLIIPPGLSSP